MTITNSENSTLTLKVWTLGSQKVSSTVNNAKHDPSKTSYFLFFGSQFGSFWGLSVFRQPKVFSEFSGFLDFGKDAFDWLNSFVRVCDFVCLGNNRWTNPIYVEFTFELCKYRRDIFTKTLWFSTKITQLRNSSRYTALLTSKGYSCVII